MRPENVAEGLPTFSKAVAAWPELVGAILSPNAQSSPALSLSAHVRTLALTKHVEKLAAIGQFLHGD